MTDPAINPTLYAARAELLAARYSSAEEFLRFFAELITGKAEAPPELEEQLQTLLQATHEPKATPPWPNFCPCCGAAPGMSALRPEADGARRSLICSQCNYEWTYQRLLCPNCQEQRFDELPIYIAEDYPHLRVECCATCKRYLIGADLVKEPPAIPLVEDIAALPLHLWATEQGYTKIKPNLFGF